MIEGIPIWLIGAMIGTLGAPGIYLVIWWIDHRKIDRIRREDMKTLHAMREEQRAEVDKQRRLDREALKTLRDELRDQRRTDKEALELTMKTNREALDRVLESYRNDVQTIANFYERNVELVKNYEKLADDLANIIHLNTQVQTTLVEQVRNNMFCPVIREKGPQG